MSQSHRARLMRVPKQEEELHIFTNPLNDFDENDTSIPLVPASPTQKQREPLTNYDYQAPLTAHSLRPNSHWLIVRRNLHRIRCMGFRDGARQGRAPDLYLGLQMTRELQRAQKKSKIGKGQTKKFDTRHVKPDDALIYDRLGEEPLALQNLLYYFSKQDVQHGTVFWDFLNEVNHVLNLKRKRTVLVQRLRRLALSLALVVYSLIGLMLFLMTISVITTITKMNDPEVEWMDQSIGGYSSELVSTR